LWTEEDAWWRVGEPMLEISLEHLMKQLEPVSGQAAREAIEPLVEDVVEKLRRYASPYFEELREHSLNGRTV
jgi:hypothetical protein